MARITKNEIECILCKSIIKFPEYIDDNFRAVDLMCGACESVMRLKFNKEGMKEEFTVVKDRWEQYKASKKFPESKELTELQDEFHRLKDI